MSRQAVKKTPGAILKEARQSLDLSLGDVAAMTRIPRTMIAHLESDRYDEYSADVFVRGHLRSYARELKVDPETLMQAYDRHVGRMGLSSDDNSQGRTAARESISKARASVAGFGSQVTTLTQQVRPSHVVAVALVLVFLFVVVNLVIGSRATAKDPAQFPQAAEQEWEVEQAVEETRWALEQPAGATDETDSSGE
jgi:cytoskeleton protein RodZ